MSNRGYAPLPNNPRLDDDAQREMDAAFDDSGDEDDEVVSQSRPLNPSPPSNNRPAAPKPDTPQIASPTLYDFENVDYDYPPPGSPPRPSAVALPNQHGNSNGFVPTSSPDMAGPARRRQNWFASAATSVLPPQFSQRLGLSPRIPAGAVGGGINNDGVFANVTAKPSAPVRVQDGDHTYLVPEETRAEAPPSYSSAQADAVPPYWETTIHVPYSTDSSELIIDSLPTGSLFSFLWNMLVSVSFQFVGFLLTYLLHTTHAARLGSRAGLGVTLIQYGFALRAKAENSDGTGIPEWSGDWRNDGDPVPTFATAAEADSWNAAHGNTTMGMMSEEQANVYVAGATTEWLSFFLMTVGWFILLTSFLGFWRVKRWERGIINSQLENPNAGDTPSRDLPVVSHLERMIGLQGMTASEFIRQGLGLSSRGGPEDEVLRHAEEGTTRRVPEGAPGDDDDEDLSQETDYMIPLEESADPERARQMRAALLHEARLQNDLRAAGFL